MLPCCFLPSVSLPLSSCFLCEWAAPPPVPIQRTAAVPQRDSSTAVQHYPAGFSRVPPFLQSSVKPGPGGLLIVLMYLIISARGRVSEEGEAQFPSGTVPSPRATADKRTCLQTTHTTLSSTDFKSVPPCFAIGGGNCPLIYNRLPFIPKSCLIKNQSRRPISAPIIAYRSVIGWRLHR